MSISSEKGEAFYMERSDPMSRLWKRAFCITVIFLLTITPAEVGAKMKESAFKLPKTVGLWTRANSPKVVDASNIFEYMNGAGELYLAYRFKKLEVYNYKARGRESIEVEIYFMETPDDAFGLLSHDWGGEPVDLSSSRPEVVKPFRSPMPRALYGAGLLRMWSGSKYARIMATRQTPESKKAVLSLGRAIVGKDELSDAPYLLNILADEIPDGWKLNHNQIRYFHTQLVLNMFYYLSLQNILTLDHSAQAVMATYEKTGGEKPKQVRVLFVKYATPEKASRALDLFRKSYITKSTKANTNIGTPEEPTIFQVKDGWLGYKLKHDSLALVFKCPDEKSAQAMINSLCFDPLK
jgi:hypothetical protein